MCQVKQKKKILQTLPAATSQLATRALSKIAQAFKPMARTYIHMFRDFLGFLVVTGVSFHQVNHCILLALMHYLLDNHFTPSNIANY